MGWVKLDDNFFRNPKVLEISAESKLLYLAGLCYAGASLTDGFIPKNAVRSLAADADISAGNRRAQELVNAGLWVEEPRGYRVHDYLEHNSSSADVRAKRDAAKARMQRHRSREQSANNARSSQDVREPETETETETEKGEANASPKRRRTRKAATVQSPTLTPEQLQRFERWYEHWPRKENRAKAEESWAAIDPDDALVDKMIATTQVYARSEKWCEDGGKFIPHPATWLNNARWNDEPPQVTPLPNGRHIRPTPMTSNERSIQDWRRKHGLVPDDDAGVIDVKGMAR